jgi:hypothetical protein
MDTFTIIIIAIGLPIITVKFYRVVLFAKANTQISKKRFARISPLYNKLKNGDPISKNEVYEYAKNLLTRKMVFELLQHNNLQNIFPDEFNTIEKAAESNLANWLEFPTELNTCPDEIEHIKRVSINIDKEDHFVHYEVFEFKVHEPHRDAKKGWMLGVVGPYFDNSEPYDYPFCTYSRFHQNSVSSEEEVKWVHENILLQH